MASETLGEVIRRLGRLSGLQSDLALTDAQLLERFARGRDEPAFAALLVRHGPMVLGVCNRLLPDGQEAEDAFQAAFLILARKAGAIRRQAVLGGVGSMTYRAWAEEASGAAKAVAAANPVQADKDKPKAAPADGPALPTGAGDEKQQKLLQDWCDAAKKAFNLRKEEFLAGKVPVAPFMDAAHRLLTAELERSATKADRVAAYEAHLRRITDFTGVVKAKADAGRLAPADVADADYFRLEAEILLEREKVKKP